MTRPTYDPGTDSSPGEEFDHPAFCRLEKWSPAKGEWVVMHAGISLLHPRRYVERLNDRGFIGRVTIVDTGQFFQLEEPVLLPSCTYCTDRHSEPHDGMCMVG